MGFIAGYAAPEQLDPAVLRERLTTFRIMPDEEPTAGYRHTVTATRLGHLLGKSNPAHPLPPTLTLDGHGNTLLTLGFLCDHGALIEPMALLRACVGTAGRALESAEGEFLAIFADAGSGAVHLVNDRFGSRPCYILEDGAHRYFASTVPAVLALARAHPRPDPLGWAQVGTLGHTLGTRTTLQGVQRMPPATHVTIGPDTMTARRYWRLVHAPDDGLDLVRHAASAFEAFRAGAALRARLAGNDVIVPLSGGLDSRMVAAAIAAGNGGSAFTLVNSASQDSTPETRVAAQVCRALGMPHRIEKVRSRYSQHAEAAIRLTGALRPLQHAAMVALYLDAMGGSVRFLLGGGPGDTLAGASVTEARHVDPAATEACVEAFCQRRLGRLRRLRAVMRDDVLDACAGPLRDSLLESHGAIQGPTGAHRLTAWRMVERQSAFTLTSLMHAHPDVGEAFCHLDYRYVDLMLRLPATWLYRRSFYRVMIHQTIPSLRPVPYANTGELVTGQLLEVRDARPPGLRLAAARAGRLVQRAAGRWLGLARRPDRGLHATLFHHDGPLIATLRDCLHGDPVTQDMLDTSKCETYLRQYEAGEHHGEEPFGTLATMCLARRVLA